MNQELDNRDNLTPSDAVESERTMTTEQTQEALNNETINEQVKKQKRKRICLVGCVAEQQNAVTAANSFNVPVLTSETGVEFIQDDTWTTYFILPEFEGPNFTKIHKAEVKHKILGPPALIAASVTGDGLPSHYRPIYNYSLRGVVTAFTGIKKRDELTHLVDLIHFMGGSIRKDLNNKVTHLICTNSYGDKYRYAQTFKLKSVRSTWVMDAWRNRDEAEFTAQNDDFTQLHLLKIFEGCRVAFIGFSESDKKYMVDQLRSNNGIETTSDDDTCTHKIISDNPVFANEPNNMTLENSVAYNDEDVGENEDGDDKYDYACQVVQRKHESFLRHLEQSEKDGNDLPVLVEEDENAKSGHLETSNMNSLHKSSDGAILHNGDDMFSTTQNISPILRDKKEEEYDAFPNESIYEDGFREAFKRKRAEDDSLDSISFMSIESTKKPKLSRAGSLTKNIRRRMSMTIVNPINNLFRPRRSTVDCDTSTYSNFETTFNESIKEPIKEKFRQIKDKVCKSSKKDHTTPKAKMRLASANLSNLKDVCTIKTPEKCTLDFAPIEFKTPKAPLPQSSTTSTSKGMKSRAKPEESSFIDIVDHAKLVVEETSMRMENGPDEPKYYVVKAEWFWTRIYHKYAPEDDFLYKDYMQSVKDEQAEHHERRDSIIHYSAKAQRKRKRQSRIVLDGTPVSTGKRRSSVSDAGILSESLIDYTASPDKSESLKLSDDITSSAKKFSMRRNHFMDFYHTESNYVGILETIVKLFKVPLEKLAEENPDQPELLNKSEVKAIFSNFLPIYQVHKKMLNSLQEINGNWKEDSTIGQIIIENRDSLLKAYPPYINFFEQMKVSLTQCAQTKPRFQAFLKINQAKPECGRQSLQELMIRPVQRLPSISLLLDDIKKHTPKTNRDHDMLSEALTTIKEVMTYINEDKRKTEGQTQMFNIYYEIENCPSELLSSHRNFVSRCEVSELSETLSRRGDSLWFFLFNDTLEICKKRSRFNHSKSPPYGNSSKGPSGVKAFKHVKLIPLSSIRTLVDIRDNPRAFALLIRNSSNIQDQRKDLLCSLSISDEEVDKTTYIKSFTKQLAENACRADAEKFVISVDSGEIGIDMRATNLGTLGKAFKFATRTGSRVTRAFSFNKTPSRKRNIASPFGSNASLTPSTISSMSNMKLHQASCMTLNEFDLDRKEHEQYQVIPLTDQMSRRNKKAAGSEGI